MNKQTKIVISIIIAIAVIAVGYLVYKKSTEPVLKEVIKIGAIYQLTGGGADWGDRAIKGLYIAADEINKNGGIYGKPVEIILEDSRSNAKDAVTAMNKLVTIENVKIVLSQQSPVVVALSPIANKNKIILIDTGSVTTAYITPDDYTFRTSYGAPYFAKSIISILNKESINSIGVLYVNNDYGLGMLNTYKELFKGKIVAESFSPEDTDFRTQILKIKIADPEVIIYSSNPKQAGVLLKQIKELGLKKPIYTDVYAIEYPLVLDIAGDAAEDVIYISQYYNTNRTDKVFQEFNNEFVNKYNEISNALSAQTYDGLMVLAYVMKQCKNPLNTDCIKDKLYKLENFQGAIGSISFDRNGEVKERPVTVKTVKNGEFVPYEE